MVRQGEGGGGGQAAGANRASADIADGEGKVARAGKVGQQELIGIACDGGVGAKTDGAALIGQLQANAFGGGATAQAEDVAGLAAIVVVGEGEV